MNFSETHNFRSILQGSSPSSDSVIRLINSCGFIMGKLLKIGIFAMSSISLGGMNWDWVNAGSSSTGSDTGKAVLESE